ncbi:hypothetical protein ACIQAC_15210 [Streptomyces sp. NPDC088387]|uniref:hypothetical protein n=1 Tax=Streptomyces sp. NPDC088387 TaxID=3365859 RepID=UPI0037F6A31C
MLLRRQPRAEESGPYWTQRGWQWSAGFLAVAVVMGGLLALTSSGSDAAGQAEAKAPAGGGPLTGEAGPGGRPEGCATDDSAGDGRPKAAPEDVGWRSLGVGRVPVSPSAGPTRIQGSLWWCFAHTPTGAALAATVIPSQMSEPGWRTVVDQQLVAGTGRDMFEFLRALVADTARPEGGKSVATYTGFSVLSYTREAATVSLLIRGSQGFTATSIEVRWSDGDWKVLPSADGSLYSQVTTVENTNDYVLWGG